RPRSDGGHVETQVLAWLRNLDHDYAAVSELPAPPNARVGALHALDRQRHAPAYHDALPDVEAAYFLGEAKAIGDVGPLAPFWPVSPEHTLVGDDRGQERRRWHDLDAVALELGSDASQQSIITKAPHPCEEHRAAQIGPAAVEHTGL